MNRNSAIRIADQVLQNSNIFPNNDVDHDEKKRDPLSSQIWRMYTKAKDNLPHGSRLENLTWRMMALTLKKNRDQDLSSEDMKPEPDFEGSFSTPKSLPTIQEAHVNNSIDGDSFVTSPFFLDHPTTPETMQGNSYFNFENISTHHGHHRHNSFQETMHLPYSPVAPSTQQAPPLSKTPRRRQSSLKGADYDKRRSPSQKSTSTECFNCYTKNTPLWRRDPAGNPLCNACGLFLKLHGVVRPLSLKTDVIKKRNRTNNKDNHPSTTTSSTTTTTITSTSTSANRSTPHQIAPNNTITTPLHSKRRRQSSKRKSQSNGMSEQELLDTPLFMTPSPSSYFPHTELTPPTGLHHSSSTSSIASLLPPPLPPHQHQHQHQRQQEGLYSMYDIQVDDVPHELLPIYTTPYADNTQHTSSLLLHNNHEDDTTIPPNTTYFY